MSSGLESYWAYYTGCVALRVVCRNKVRVQAALLPAPKGKKKQIVDAVILGRRYKTLLYPVNIEYILDNLTHQQAKEAVKDIPLKNPSGCSWEELWSAYKERYMEDV